MTASAQIRAELAFNNIRYYPFDSDENDEEEQQLNEAIQVRTLSSPSRTASNVRHPAQAMIPFAVVGSERTLVVDGKTIRCRKNRWGIVNVENEQHCEFIYLRNFLTRCVGPRSG
jgi:septin 3/9/12